MWGNRENISEEKWQEIFRLLFANKENPQRFRQGFSQMLAVQVNQAADGVLESELRQLEDELSEENFYSQLEDYLRQGDWRKADEETAWLFYVVMVQRKYKDWSELCQKFPSETLNEIDQLWVKYSEGSFGFSIQKRIKESLGGKAIMDSIYEVYQVINYESLTFSTETEFPVTLPVRCYTRIPGDLGGKSWVWSPLVVHNLPDLYDPILRYKYFNNIILRFMRSYQNSLLLHLKPECDRTD